MYKKKRILGVIPARGGSKGLKDKNIKVLKGKPLIAYTINAALKANVFDSLIVNTDSEKIAAISQNYGATIPFLRPKSLGADDVSIMNTYIHTLNYYMKREVLFDYIMVLLPTVPLRSSEDILGALNLIFEKTGDSVVSVTKADHSPLWMNTIDQSLSMKDFISNEIRHKNRQELPTYYRLNGAIYLAKTQVLYEDKDWYSRKVFAYKMPKNRSVDIDTFNDFQYAEYLMSKKGEIWLK